MCARWAILGQTLVEQAGQELFQSVEELRRLLIEHRETVRRSPQQAGSSEQMQQAQQITDSSMTMDVYTHAQDPQKWAALKKFESRMVQ